MFVVDQEAPVRQQRNDVDEAVALTNVLRVVDMTHVDGLTIRAVMHNWRDHEADDVFFWILPIGVREGLCGDGGRAPMRSQCIDTSVSDASLDAERVGHRCHDGLTVEQRQKALHVAAVHSGQLAQQGIARLHLSLQRRTDLPLVDGFTQPQ